MSYDAGEAEGLSLDATSGDFPDELVSSSDQLSGNCAPCLP